MGEEFSCDVEGRFIFGAKSTAMGLSISRLLLSGPIFRSGDLLSSSQTKDPVEFMDSLRLCGYINGSGKDEP
jgi:hypothetical protein